MGATESKRNQGYRSNKHLRFKSNTTIPRKCHHKNKELETLIGGNKNETIVPLVGSLPLNPRLQGSILHHSFPMQRSQSEIQIIPYELGNSNQFDHGSYDYPNGVDDYQKHMQRVDEENRPVLEGLCPDKMYVSTNDLRICNTQRLPPPLRCKMSQGFFRPIPPPQSNQKKTTLNSSFL